MKEVLISGASSGIGLASAQLFSDQGWKVHLLGRNREKLESCQKLLKNPSQVFVADLSSVTDCARLDRELNQSTSNISVLVNNAGIYRPAAFVREDASVWLEQFETNLFGAVRLTHMAWKQLVSHRGAVVNVSSTLGLRPIENTGAYSASKAAMNNWTQTLALEAGPQGVRVNAICPGLVDTPIHSFHGSQKESQVELRKKLDQMQPLKRMGQAQDIAKAIYFAATDSSSWMTGALMAVDGGISVTTRDP